MNSSLELRKTRCDKNKPVSNYEFCDCEECKEAEAIRKWSPEYNNYSNGEEDSNE